MFGRNQSHTGNENAVVLSINEENSIAGFKVYPNPTNTNGFYVETTLNGAKSIQIFDVVGKQVFSKNIIGQEKIQNLNLRAGIYLLKVSENEKYVSFKLIIK
jgi:hypothetical protein